MTSQSSKWLVPLTVLVVAVAAWRAFVAHDAPPVAANDKAPAAPTSAAPTSAASTSPDAPPAAGAPATAAEADQPGGVAADRPTPPAPAPGPTAEELGLYFTANGLGELEDCGCKQKPLGGLARRALWLKERRARLAGSLVVETGGILVADPALVTATAEELVSRTETIFKAYAYMGYAAVNVGPHELAIARPNLMRLATAHATPLVSSNLRDTASGKPAFAPHLIREIGGLKIGILGLTSLAPPAREALFDKQGLTLEDLIVAARREAEALRAQGCQLVVALSMLSRGEIDDLAEKVPQVDLVLGSLDQELTLRPEFLGRGFWADPYHKGKWVGEFIVRPGQDRTRWVVSDLRDKLQIEQVRLEREIGYYTKKFAEEDKAGADKPVDTRARQFEQERFAKAKARLQRVLLESRGAIDPGVGASTLRLQLTAMNADELAEDPAVVAWVQAHKARFPAAPGVGH